jgi:hypothetical protein
MVDSAGVPSEQWHARLVSLTTEKENLVSQLLVLNSQKNALIQERRGLRRTPSNDDKYAHLDTEVSLVEKEIIDTGNTR